MSLSFDLVINCDLKEAVPEDAIEAISYLIQPDYVLKKSPQLIYFDETGSSPTNMWDIFGDKERFLVPNPAYEIIANFRRVLRYRENHRDVYRYRLQYCGSSVLDDIFYQYHISFAHWLLTVSYEDYIGYYMETHGGGTGVHHLLRTSGKLNS